MIHAINADTLKHLDGGAAGAIINAAIGEAARDLDERGDDDKPRKVEIILTLSKREDGLVECEVEAAARVPRRRTASTIARPKRDGDQSRLVFQQYEPADPDQRTLDEAESQD